MRFLYAIALLLLSPTALAHNTVETDDSAYFMTIGHTNEPTTTFMKTALDFVVRENDGGERGDEVAGVHETLTATYFSPSGQQMEVRLQTQHGAVGRYTSDAPFYLTEPGQYTIHLQGTIGDTVVDDTYDVSGPVPEWGEHTFPAVNTLNNQELQDEIAALQAQVTQLQADLQAMQADMDAMAASEDTENGSTPMPTPGLALLMMGIVALAIWSKRNG